MKNPNGIAQMDDPNGFAWQVYGAVCAVAGGSFAFLRWIFGERSRVLKEHRELARELRGFIKTQSEEMEKFRSVIARLNQVVESERAARHEAENHESVLQIELQTARAALADKESQIQELIRICRAHGIEVPNE
jgi:hypothetical protein